MINKLLKYIPATIILLSAIPAKSNEHKANIVSSSVKIEGAIQGSGVIIDRVGSTYKVMSAWHVIGANKSGEEVDIITADDNVHSAILSDKERIGGLDLGIISFRSSAEYPLVPIAKSIPTIESKVSIYGFPNSAKDGRYSTGKIVALAQLNIGQGYQLLYTNQTLSGMSGSPVVNTKGQLIGIHGRGEIDIKLQKKDSVIAKTGINQGIPILLYTKWQKGGDFSVNSLIASSYSEYILQANNALDYSGSDQTVIRLASQALAIKQSSYAYYLRSSAQKNLGNITQALNDATDAVVNDPSNSFYITGRAHLYLESKNYENAEKDFRRALNADDSIPNEIKITSLGATLIMRNKHDDAINLLRPSTLKYPNSALINQNLAVAYHAKKLPFLAERFAKKAITNNKSLVMPYLTIANIKLKSYFDHESALKVLDEALLIHPNNDDLIMRKCKIASEAELLVAVNYCSESLRSNNPKYRLDSLILRAFSHQSSGNYRKAIHDFEKLRLLFSFSIR